MDLRYSFDTKDSFRNFLQAQILHLCTLRWAMHVMIERCFEQCQHCGDWRYQCISTVSDTPTPEMEGFCHTVIVCVIPSLTLL